MVWNGSKDKGTSREHLENSISELGLREQKSSRHHAAFSSVLVKDFLKVTPVRPLMVPYRASDLQSQYTHFYKIKVRF